MNSTKSQVTICLIEQWMAAGMCVQEAYWYFYCGKNIGQFFKRSFLVAHLFFTICSLGALLWPTGALDQGSISSSVATLRLPSFETVDQLLPGAQFLSLTVYRLEANNEYIFSDEAFLPVFETQHTLVNLLPSTAYGVTISARFGPRQTASSEMLTFRTLPEGDCLK